MLLSLPLQSAQAQNGPDPCTYFAARSALPSMQQSWAFSPAGCGSLGYAPLTYRFGVSPYVEAAFYGPPGLAPSFGPVGPGLTANLIARGVLRPQGFNLTDPANVRTLVSLASLQQGELGTLNTRYSNSASYQTAAATWAGAYASQATAVFARVAGECSQATATSPLEPPSGGK
jgi:hypothetical protein